MTLLLDIQAKLYSLAHQGASSGTLETIMNAVKTTSLLTTRSRVRVPPLTPMHIKVCIGVSVAQMDRAGCLTIFVIINLIRNNNVDKNYQQPNWGSP